MTRAAEPVTLPDTDQFDIRAKSGRVYRIFVGVPQGPRPDGGWPVLYHTDGNGNFPILVSAVRRLSVGSTSSLVVGIGYPTDDVKVHHERRTYDLTPPTSADWLKSFPAGGPPIRAGGQEELLTFIEDELKPRIRKTYRCDSNRQTLFGHSLGGLFTLHVLCSRPEAFQNYVASSPSIWWNAESLLAEERKFIDRYVGKSMPHRVLITVGGREETTDPKTPADVADVLRKQRMVSHAREMADRLSQSQIKNLLVQFRTFADEDHRSALLVAAGRAVRFASEDGSNSQP